VPDDDIRVSDTHVGVSGNPGGKAFRGYPGRLGDVAIGRVGPIIMICCVEHRVNFGGETHNISKGAKMEVKKPEGKNIQKRTTLVPTFCDVYCGASKVGSFPRETISLWQERRRPAADQLIRNRLVRVRVAFVRVGNVPGPALQGVRVRDGRTGSSKHSLVCIESVSVAVPRSADSIGGRTGVDLKHRVLDPVNVRVQPQTEQVLVDVGVDAGIRLGPLAERVLARKHGVRVGDTRELNLELGRAVLVEDPVDSVLVAGGGEDLRDDQLARAGGSDETVAEVGVLEEDPVILLVDADCVSDDCDLASFTGEVGIHVMDRVLAVAPEGEAVGHVAAPVFSEIE